MFLVLVHGGRLLTMFLVSVHGGRLLTMFLVLVLIDHVFSIST